MNQKNFYLSLPQPVPLLTHSLIQCLDGLPQLQPLATSPGVTRYRRPIRRALTLRITYLQFQKDYGPKPGGTGANPPVLGGKPAEGEPEQKKESDSSKTTMKLSAAGLELSSQIIGLFVLGFSLAFFYLYVKEVYPIQVLNLNQTNSQADTSKTKSKEASPAEAPKAKP